MAIRRISDLPKFQLKANNNTDTSASSYADLSELKYSQFEVSHNQNGDEHSLFKSERIDFIDLSGFITHDIVKNELIFSGLKTFDSINVLDDINLTGDLNINNGSIYLSGNSFKANLEDQIILSAKEGIQLSSGNSFLINADEDVQSSFKNGSFKARDNIEISAKNNLSVYSGNNTTFKTDGIYSITLSNIESKNESSFKILNNNIALLYLDNSGQFNFRNDIIGTAIQAKWADLAEMYSSDYKYPAGTLIKFGGEKEITIADEDVNGIITAKPGFILNNKEETDSEIYCGIAMIGRTPVRVEGKIEKFDKIELSDIPGVARKHNLNSNKKIIGIALSNKEKIEEDLIECVVKLQF